MQFDSRKLVPVLALAAFVLLPALGAQQALSAPIAEPVTTATAANYPGGTFNFHVTPAAWAAYAAPAPSAAGPAWTPNYELFLGYSNFRNLPMSRAGNRIAWLSGASGSMAFNFNRYFGLVVDFADYRDTRFGPFAAPTGGVVSSRGNVFTYMAGPRVSFRHDRYTPFVQALIGEADPRKVTLTNCTGFGCTPLPNESSYAFNAGGGLDITLTHHIALRLFQAEYAMTRFANPVAPSANKVWQHDARLSTGLVFRFGGERAATLPPPPPPPAPVAAAPPVPRPNRPPTMTCSIDRNTLSAGEHAQITAVANSRDNNPLTYRWAATGGQVSGSASSTDYDTTGLAPGSYTISGHVDDDRGGAADCSVSVSVRAVELAAVAAPPVAVLEANLALHSIYFPTDQPRADNPATDLAASQRQILHTLARDFKVYLAIKPDAHLTLEGHADERASVDYNNALAERRVAAAKAYLVSEGIPAENIDTHSFGKHEELDAAQVRAQINDNPDITDAERQKIFANLPSIILAQNRRVDIVLSGTGQQSTRHYPFNAKDALSLLSDTALIH